MSATHEPGTYDFIVIARNPSYPKGRYDGTIVLGGRADDAGMAEIAIRCLRGVDPHDRLLADPSTRFDCAFRMV